MGDENSEGDAEMHDLENRESASARLILPDLDELGDGYTVPAGDDMIPRR